MSIVVNNHNYEEFLANALRSALAQRETDVEVVVVDDGSTDASREVITRFADRVSPIFQNNQGQSGTFNAGFAATTGDVVLFLDADDELAPGTATAVADAFAANPAAGRVVFRLEVVDRAGNPSGALTPPPNAALPDGDVRQAALSFPDDLAWPPTTGNAFAAWLLRRVLPLPVNGDPVGADFMLHALTPLLAPVVALDQVGGKYRVHDRNAHRRGSYAAQSRYLVRQAAETHAVIERQARDLGYGVARPRSVTIAAHRLVSLRLGGPDHPIPDDSRGRALAAGLRAVMGRPDVGISRRLLYFAWFSTVAAAPQALVRALVPATLKYSPESPRRGPQGR